MSLFSGFVTVLFAGLIIERKQHLCVLIYFLLITLFGFYPYIGPFWVYPLMLWFHIIGFVLLSLPLSRFLSYSPNFSSYTYRLFFGILFLSLISSLAGQLTGSIVFEFISLNPLEDWKTTWQFLTLVYPVERILIALTSTLIIIPVYKLLKSTHLI
jgi:hypothetical protein